MNRLGFFTGEQLLVMARWGGKNGCKGAWGGVDMEGEGW